MPSKSHEPVVPYVSLFSGALGLDLGLERAGFEPLVVNDNDAAAVASIRLNRPKLPCAHMSVTDISREILEEASGHSLLNIPLVVGGPPCQAFSVMGRRRGLSDERGSLIFEFIRMVDEMRPHMFLMENVRGLMSMAMLPKGAPCESGEEWKREQGSLYKEICRQFESRGYRLDCFIVNSANYGAPQVRERVMVVGNRHGLAAEFPAIRHSNRAEDGLPSFATLADVIGAGFIDPDRTLLNFSERKLSYLAHVPPGGNWRSLPESMQKEAMGKQYYLKGGRSSSWRKLSWGYPSPTVHTLPNHATTSMCHPDELRALTVGECAAIQEFPADFQFAGTAAERYRQVGNAVPVKLGEVAGECLRQLYAAIRARPSEDSERSVVTADLPSAIHHLRPHVRVRSWFKNGEALAGDHDYGKQQTQPAQLDLELFEAGSTRNGRK